MSMFVGNFVTNSIENHVFSSFHKEMEAIGMHSFTLTSCSKIWNANQKNLNIILDRPVTKLGDEETILGGGGGLNITNISGIYYYYDHISETMQSGVKSYTDWKDIIKYHEDKVTKKEGFTEDGSKDAILKNISISLNGGVKFKFPESIFAVDQENPGSLSGDVIVILKFFKRDWDSDTDKDARILGFSSNTPVVGMARTPGGVHFNHNGTLENSDPAKVGIKEGLSTGGIKNPKNAVAAPVSYYFNEGTGEYESGTKRILAILLEDIEAAPIKDFNISYNDIVNFKPNNFIDNSSELFTAYRPPSGPAMPVQMQNNNPFCLTPNFIKICDGNDSIYRPETVIAVNRFRKAYKKGSHVFLTKIGREWIIEAQPQDDLLSPVKLSEWTFSKLITSSDDYFKDDRWKDGVPNVMSKVTPSDYENSARYKFYTNVQGKIADLLGKFWTSTKSFTTMNGPINTLGNHIITFQPSPNYLISNIFDQLDKGIGGLSSRSWIGRTNLNKGIPSEYYMEEIGVFWGPVFVEGYQSIIFTPDLTDPQGNNTNLFFDTLNIISDNPESALGTPNTINGTPNTINGPGKYTPTTYDIPAECTTKLLNPAPLYDGFSKLGSLNNDTIIGKILKTPFYDSKKVSNSKIQFIPLTANLVGANDPNASDAFTSYERNFKDRMTEYFTGYYGFGVDSSIWGKMFVRTPGFTMLSNPTAKIALKNSQCFFKTSPFDAKNIDAQTIPPYDCYIQRDADNPPIGYPDTVFNDIGSSQGGNCVGIICGKNTITKRGGGDINFIVTSNFGFAPFSTISAGNFNVGVIALGQLAIPLVTTNDARQSAGRPQYGSYSDDIYSFGTTVLAIRVFDAWPEECTLYDPRYFSVIHFNPGEIGSTPLSSPVEYKKKTISVDKISTSVDFRVPTNEDGDIIKEGEIIKKDTLLLPKDYWKVNTIRRGMMLTNGGFSYPKLQIGARVFNVKTDTQADGTTKAYRGKKYVKGQVFNLINDITIKITNIINDGEIPDDGWEFVKNDAGDPLKGDLLPGDFPRDIILPLSRDESGQIISGSQPAIFRLEEGEVYSIMNKDNPPVEHIPLKTISSSSNRGKSEVVDEVLTSTINVAKNNSGQYDLFTHFHNDITHTLMYHPLYGRTKLQYITMDIT